MSLHILDSSAWLECLDGGPNTKHFAAVLRKLPELLVPSIILTEVRKVVLRQRTSAQAEEVTRAMRSAMVIPIADALAISAADIAIRHQLPLADSFIYAVTLAQKATLWTQDEDFNGLPHVRYFPKQNGSISR